jgi:hypothetical protein
MSEVKSGANHAVLRRRIDVSARRYPPMQSASVDWLGRRSLEDLERDPHASVTIRSLLLHIHSACRRQGILRH